MIRYDLRCACRHAFDGWFRSSADFDAQASRGLLDCPVCGSSKVEKALMAPAVRLKAAAKTASSGTEADAPVESVALVDDRQAKLRGMLRELKKHVTETVEDVGETFPRVARQMHAEEIKRRPIRGKATADEAKALAEEGVPIQPLPNFPDDLN